MVGRLLLIDKFDRHPHERVALKTVANYSSPARDSFAMTPRAVLERLCRNG